MTHHPIPSALLSGGLLLAAAVGLAACSGGGGGNGPPRATDPVAFFGTAFAADYHASATSTPPVPKQGDIIPVSLTTNPQALNF